MYTRRKVASLTLVWVVLTLGALGILYAYVNGQANVYPYSPYQSKASMQRDYQACKQNATEGFDCMMTPVLVSKQFIIENSK